jgi:hypothetical protein
MRRWYFAVIVLLNCVDSLAQTVDTVPHFSIVSSVGLLASRPAPWNFIGEREAVTLRPGTSAAVGTSFGPFAAVKGAQMTASVEIAVGRMRTVDHSHHGDKREIEVLRIPIMLWFIVETPNDLSPYVKIGTGLSWTEFRETYTDSYYPNAHFSNWNYSWGIGAGLRYQISQMIALALFVETWTNEGSILYQNEWGLESGTKIPYSMRPVGLQVSLRL